MNTKQQLRQLMSAYTVSNLRNGLSQEYFLDTLERFLSLDDHSMEGFDSPDAQRDLTVRFQHGHNHDFGARGFNLKGLMKDRHIHLLSHFVGVGALPLNLSCIDVLDIGCWTGGVSLLLSAMGADVDAIDEVYKYTGYVAFLRDSFNIDGLCVMQQSLYDMTSYDMGYVLCLGVLYHVTDPVVALRKIFDVLVDGGILLLETAITGDADASFRYCGPRHTQGERPFRMGWNWLVPSRLALQQMLEDVGFEDIVLIPFQGRMTAVAKRVKYKDMLRSGLSMEVR